MKKNNVVEIRCDKCKKVEYAPDGVSSIKWTSIVTEMGSVFTEFSKGKPINVVIPIKDTLDFCSVACLKLYVDNLYKVASSTISTIPGTTPPIAETMEPLKDLESKVLDLMKENTTTFQEVVNKEAQDDCSNIERLAKKIVESNKEVIPLTPEEQEDFERTRQELHKFIQDVPISPEPSPIDPAVKASLDKMNEGLEELKKANAMWDEKVKEEMKKFQEFIPHNCREQIAAEDSWANEPGY